MTTDPHWGYVQLLIGNDAGASGSHELTDQSLRNRFVNNVGNNVFYSEANPPPGLATTLSFQFNGQLQISPAPSYWMFHNYDFCIEGFLRLPSTQSVYIGDGLTPRAFEIARDGNDLVASFSGDGMTWTFLDGARIGTVPLGAWFHFAVYRVLDNFYGAIGGQVIALGDKEASISPSRDPTGAMNGRRFPVP